MTSLPILENALPRLTVPMIGSLILSRVARALQNR
jgi:hypothetical protein